MARIIVTAETPTERQRSPSSDREPVLLDEKVSSIHLCDGHAADQLIERLAWAVTDAEDAERTRTPVAAR
jgi:hypothetical protein